MVVEIMTAVALIALALAVYFGKGLQFNITIRHEYPTPPEIKPAEVISMKQLMADAKQEISEDEKEIYEGMQSLIGRVNEMMYGESEEKLKRKG